MEWYIYYIVLAIASITAIWSRKHRHKPAYPPGPPPDPIIGHLRALPHSNQEVEFRKMAKTYGDIMYLHVPGKSFLVLNSLNATVEILEKRSRIYCDRSKLPLYDLMGWKAAFSLMNYGKRYLKHRRIVGEHLTEKKCVSYWPLQTRYARRLVIRLADSPTDWMKHLDRFAAEVIVKITYGKEIVDNDPYLDICERALATFTSCGGPGGTPVDFLPILKYFPAWFPGTYYAFKARSLIPAVQEMYSYPFEDVQRQMRDGTAQPSYITSHLEQLHGTIPDDEHIEDLKGSAVQLFVAGAETTASTLAHFVQAMVLFPEVQMKAQQEIDRVIGKSRLPELNDRGSLPYVQAVINEVLRWNSAVPLGVPHVSTEDDVYKGMYIPRGTTVIANAYAILRDETIYKDADRFNPSRYLPEPEGDAEPEPVGHFGFGRRICVGRYFADASLFIAIASIFATLNIGRAKDNNGREIIPGLEFETGFTSRPKPFPCVIEPRDKASEKMIKQTQLWDET